MTPASRQALRRIAALTTLLTAAPGCGTTSPQPAPVATPEATVTASAGADGTQQVVVEGTDDLVFTPAQLRARPGSLTITFRVTGSVPHTLDFDALHTGTGNVNGHNTATLHLTDLTRGTYRYDCAYHPAMIGELIIG